MIRLIKYLAQHSPYSRRQAQRLLESGRVTVRDQLAQPGDWIFDDDSASVSIDGLHLEKPKPIYLAYHKPVGVDCNCVPEDSASITNHVVLDSGQRIFPVGRLDKDSHGLIFLTNDGDFSHRLMHAQSQQEKTYRVVVNKPLPGGFAKKMAEGVPVKGQITRSCVVTIISETEFEIVLSQGLNRQIRKMCQYLGVRVVDLQRTKIKSFELVGLQAGEWREITASVAL